MYVTLFNFTSIATLAWLLVIFLPKWKITRKMVELKIFPIYLSVIYVVGVVPWLISNGLGVIQDFGNPEGVIRILAEPDIALIAWIHILAFDQAIGFNIYGDNMRHGYVPLPLQSVILFLTLMFGPIGYLIYQGARMSRRGKQTQPAAA